MALFEVIDPNAGPAPPGPWEMRPAPAASFGADGEAEARAPVWRVSLPADPAVAQAELRAAEVTLVRQEQTLDTATRRLRTLAARGAAASFGATTTAAPETRLLLLLNEPSGGGAASFGVGGDDGGELAAAEEDFAAFVQQVQDAVANFAVVETRRERTLIARSAVSWTGDLRSLFGTGLAGEEKALHRRSLGLVMRSRAALLRTFATVMRGATIVALMASSPVGAARALPAAWRFVDDLLRESRGSGDGRR